MSSVGSAHEVSLPLVALIRKLEGLPTHQIIGEMTSYVVSHELRSDIEACVVFSDGDQKVQLVALTDRGHDVLAEVLNCCEFVPCPLGECEFDGSTCRWCGSIQH
jgi:hypothetical protein